MSDPTRCPQCGSENTRFSRKHFRYDCEDCLHEFVLEKPFVPRKLFISYGHDEYVSLAMRLRDDLRERGHHVWFDEERLDPGHDWEAFIDEGLKELARADRRAESAVILLMTPHSVRRPDGCCLNEVSRALSRGLRTIPLLVMDCEPPLSISRIQWLDMRACIPISEREELYRPRLDRLLRAIEDDSLDFEGPQSRLLTVLEPIQFSADIARLLRDFTGREWVFDEVDAWLHNANGEKLFWISGAPGVGKSAIAAWVCENRREIAAFHFCDINNEEKRNPAKFVRSVAYQLSTQLPEYGQRLAQLPLRTIVEEYREAYTLFDKLVIQPLAENFTVPDRALVVLIDALDEATSGRQNEIVRLLALCADKTPSWLRFLVTSRPTPVVVHSLQRCSPYVIDALSPDNLADVDQFIRARLQTPCLAKHLAQDSHSPEEVVRVLSDKCEGNFAHAVIALRDIEHGHYRIDQLDDLSPGLAGLYHAQFMNEFWDNDMYREARPLFEVLIAACEPLSVSLLSASTDLDMDRRLPYVLGRMGSFLTSVPGYHSLSHKSLAEWLTNRDFAGAYYADARQGHERLAALCWSEYLESSSSMSAYATCHLPTHLIGAERWDDLYHVLTDFLYLETRALAGCIFDLAGDFNRAISAMSVNCPYARVFRLLEQAIRADIHFISHHPEALFQCVWNNGWWYDCPQASAHYQEPDDGWPAYAPPWQHPGPKLHELIECWRKAKEETSPNSPWLRCLRPPLVHLGTSLQMTLYGHEGGINAVSCSPDGSRIASGSRDKTIRVWDAYSGAGWTVYKHEGTVTSISFSSDGLLLASGSEDGTIRIWDTESSKDIPLLSKHEGLVSSVSFSPDASKLVSGSEDRTIRIWSADSRKELDSLHGHEDTVFCVSYSSDGLRIVSGSGDKTVRVWDAATGQQLSVVRGHKGAVLSTFFSSDGRRIVSTSEDKTLRIWDAVTGQELNVLRGHEGWVLDAAFSPDGLRLVSGSEDRTVRIWDAETGQQLALHRGHEDGVYGVSFLPDGRRLVSGSSDNTVRVWDVDSDQALAVLRGHKGVVSSASLSPDGRKVASGSEDTTVRLWDTETAEEIGVLHGHEGMVLGMSFSFDSSRIVSGAYDSTIRIWDADICQEVAVLSGHEGPVEGVAFSSDGHWVVSGSWDHTVRVWEAENGKELAVLRGHGVGVRSVVFSPSDRQIASGSVDGKVRVWSVDNGKELTVLRGHERSVRGLAYSPDGDRIVSSSSDQTVRIWDVHSGQQLDVIHGSADYIAIAARLDQDSLRCLCRGQETEIRTAATDRSFAWFPKPLDSIITTPGTRRCIGITRNQLCVFTVEGE